jgi:6-phosphogluconolactonase (cycloisomerase 2 family)
MMIRKTMLVAAGLCAFAVTVSQTASAHGRWGTDLRRHGVFVLGNDPEANSVISLELKDGELTPVGSVAAGGKGGAAGNQGGLALDQGRGVLFAVNAGSHSIATFDIAARSLELESVTPAEGLGPMSIATCTPAGHKRKPLVYVLNEESRSIAGFALNRANRLEFLRGSVQSISENTASGAAQILFDNTCSVVVVVERNPASFMIYPIDRDGVAGTGKNVPSFSVGQLGSAVTRYNQLFVSETGTSAASSFALDLTTPGITPITQTLANTQAGSCWAVATRRTFRCDGWGRECTMGYVMNAGTANITSYAVRPNGQLSLREDIAQATLGSAFDGALADDDRYLIVQSRASTEERALNLYEIARDGTLEYLQVLEGMPATINSVAAIN